LQKLNNICIIKSSRSKLISTRRSTVLSGVFPFSKGTLAQPTSDYSYEHAGTSPLAYFRRRRRKKFITNITWWNIMSDEELLSFWSPFHENFSSPSPTRRPSKLPFTPCKPFKPSLTFLGKVRVYLSKAPLRCSLLEKASGITR